MIVGISAHLASQLTEAGLSVLSNHNDQSPWKIPVDTIKSTQSWAVPWDKSDDAALLTGIWKHGFGSWDAVHDDTTLGLKGKFFLDLDKKAGRDTEGTPATDAQDKDKATKKAKKQNAPAPVHLVRRGDYLLGILRDCEAATQYRKEATTRKKEPGVAGLAEKAARDRDTSSAPASKSKKMKAGPTSEAVPSKKKVSEQTSSKAEKPESSRANNATNGNGKRSAKPESDSGSGSDSGSDSDSGSEIDTEACKEMLRCDMLVQR